MFELDQAISGWRQQMAASGIKMLDVLNELENHLREDVDQQVRSGLTQQQAFDAAVQRMGESKALKREFRKVNRHRAWGFRNNPPALNLLAAWLLLRALEAWPILLVVSSYLIKDFELPPHILGLWGIQISSVIISILLGIGLLRRKNVFRVCAIAWFALFITGTLGHLATHGLAGSVYAHLPHIPASATIQFTAFGFLRVSYPVFYAVLLFNTAMNFFGLLLLARPSIRKLFRPVCV
jgi:hypothetical protein